jgi:hypothetical protein
MRRVGRWVSAPAGRKAQSARTLHVSVWHGQNLIAQTITPCSRAVWTSPWRGLGRRQVLRSDDDRFLRRDDDAAARCGQPGGVARSHLSAGGRRRDHVLRPGAAHGRGLVLHGAVAGRARGRRAQLARCRRRRARGRRVQCAAAGTPAACGAGGTPAHAVHTRIRAQISVDARVRGLGWPEVSSRGAGEAWNADRGGEGRAFAGRRGSVRRYARRGEPLTLDEITTTGGVELLTSREQEVFDLLGLGHSKSPGRRRPEHGTRRRTTVGGARCAGDAFRRAARSEQVRRHRALTRPTRGVRAESGDASWSGSLLRVRSANG